MESPEVRPLAHLAAESGVTVPCAGNLPLDMGDPQCVWFIETGAVDLFLVERRDGVEQSAPQHLLRAGPGRLLPGVGPQAGHTTLALIAKGLPGTVLRRLTVAGLAPVRGAELAEHVDAWLMDVSAILSRDVLHRPRPDVLVESGQASQTMSGTLSARRGVGVGAGEGGTVHGPHRSGGGRARRRTRGTPDTGQLVHADGRSRAFHSVLRSPGRGRPAAAGAGGLSRRGVLAGASQPRPGGGGPGEPGASTGNQPPHR